MAAAHNNVRSSPSLDRVLLAPLSSECLELVCGKHAHEVTERNGDGQHPIIAVNRSPPTRLQLTLLNLHCLPLYLSAPSQDAPLIPAAIIQFFKIKHPPDNVSLTRSIYFDSGPTWWEAISHCAYLITPH